MHENRNLFLFLIEINNIHHTRHILPIPRTCIWRCDYSLHRTAPGNTGPHRVRTGQEMTVLLVKVDITAATPNVPKTV